MQRHEHGEAQDARSAPVPAPQAAAPAAALSLASPAAVLALSRTAGNRAVAAVLSRTVGAGGSGSGPIAEGKGAEGSGGTPDFTPFDAASATDEERLGELPARIAAQDRATVRAIWEAFGDRAEVARSHDALFADSIRLVPELLDLFADVAARFKSAVEGKALEHLGANRDFVGREMERLGVMADPGARTAEQDSALAELRALAGQARRALEAKQALLDVPVGYGKGSAGGAEGSGPAPTVVTFSPSGEKPVHPGPREEGFATWEEVNAQWTPVEAALASVQATSPTIFAVIERASGDADATAAVAALEQNEGTAAADAIDGALRDLASRLEETAEGIGGRYTWTDLAPLHEQVLAQPPFTDAFEGAVARALIADARKRKEDLDTGLMAAGMMAALLGLFASGGLAAVLAIGEGAAGGASAIRSAGDWDRLSTLRRARTGHAEHDLVKQGAVDASELTAVLDAVFAFLDVRGALGAFKALGAKRVAARLAEFAGLAAGDAEEALAAAIAGMGPAKALDAVGGLQPARTKLGPGSSAVRQAESYSDGLKRELADALGGDSARRQAAEELRYGDAAAADGPAPAPAPEELYARARKWAAARTGLPEDRALAVAIPDADGPAKVAAIAKTGAETAAEVSEEYAKLTTVEARVDAVHAEAVVWGNERTVFRPEKVIQDVAGARFDPTSWTVIYGRREFSAATRTNAQFEALRALAIHELRHAEQFVLMARYLLGQGTSAGDITSKFAIHRKGVQSAQALGALTAADGAPYLEAKKFYDSIYGVGAARRDVILKELAVHMSRGRRMTVAATIHKRILKKLEQAVAERRPRAEVEDLLRQLDRAKAAYLKLFEKSRATRAARLQNEADYLALAEESDAYEVQAAYERELAARRVAAATPPPAPEPVPPAVAVPEPSPTVRRAVDLPDEAYPDTERTPMDTGPDTERTPMDAGPDTERSPQPRYRVPEVRYRVAEERFRVAEFDPKPISDEEWAEIEAEEAEAAAAR